MITVYDLEQFQNFHSCFAVDKDSGAEYYFEISDFQDDSVNYYKWLEQQQGMIGFNNLAYDYPLLEAFIKLFERGLRGGELARALYKEGQRIIKSKWGIPEWKIMIPQLDLFKIHHFDNLAKITSLKDLQVAMNWKNVQDLPFKFDHHVSNDEREEIKKYNKNDVYSTLEFYKKSKDVINLRKTLQKKFGINCLNWNDPKIGEQILLTKIAKKKKVPKSFLKNQQTPRAQIDLSGCILPFNIQNKEIQDYVDELSKKVIEKTKGSINHRIVFKGMPYDFGTGGIHGCKNSKVWKRSNDYLILTSDVSSYYPNLAIQNGYYPEHLGYDFVEVYSEIYDERVEAKYAEPKTSDTKATDAGLKLGLNGVYGFVFKDSFTILCKNMIWKTLRKQEYIQ